MLQKEVQMNKVEILGTKESLYIEHLYNCLDIYMQPNDKVKNFYITLNVKYGSIYTNYKFNGESIMTLKVSHISRTSNV